MNITADKIRAVWNVAEVVIEEAVVASESLNGQPTPEAKKAFIKDTVLGFLKHLEAEKNFIPDYAEGLAFKAISFMLDSVIDRVIASTAAKAPATAAAV